MQEYRQNANGGCWAFLTKYQKLTFLQKKIQEDSPKRIKRPKSLNMNSEQPVQLFHTILAKCCVWIYAFPARHLFERLTRHLAVELWSFIVSLPFMVRFAWNLEWRCIFTSRFSYHTVKEKNPKNLTKKVEKISKNIAKWLYRSPLFLYYGEVLTDVSLKNGSP